MKITIENDDHKCMVESKAAILSDVVELFKDALKGFGFQHENVEEYFE
jgi:hypothetical protein